MRFTCTVCFYEGLDSPPRNYEICPCCGTEFGSDDEILTHAQLREQWIRRSGPWFFGAPPKLWNPWLQLMRAGQQLYVPRFAILTTTANVQGGERVTVGNSSLRLLAA
jgi:hypothetical protein